jgi:hypothetical protein
MLQTTAYLLLATWHQSRAFLFSANKKRDFSGWFDNSEKGNMSGQVERLRR